jgi:hypothetical protein
MIDRDEELLGKRLLAALEPNRRPGARVRLGDLPIVLQYDEKDGWKVSENSQDQRDMDLWRAGMMKRKRIIIDYNKLRRIVMGLYDAGANLKQQGYTFSHGSIGNEYLAFAKDIDDLVSELEPHNKICIVPTHVQALDEKSNEDEIKRLREELSKAQVLRGRLIAYLQPAGVFLSQFGEIKDEQLVEGVSKVCRENYILKNRVQYPEKASKRRDRKKPTGR